MCWEYLLVWNLSQEYSQSLRELWRCQDVAHRESLYLESQLVDLLRNGTSCMNAKSRWNMIPNLMRNFCWWTWRAPKFMENPLKINGWNILMEVWWKDHVPCFLRGWWLEVSSPSSAKRELFFSVPQCFSEPTVEVCMRRCIDSTLSYLECFFFVFFQRLVMPMPSSFLMDVGIINTGLYFFKARHEVSTTYILQYCLWHGIRVPHCMFLGLLYIRARRNWHLQDETKQMFLQSLEWLACRQKCGVWIGDIRSVFPYYPMYAWCSIKSRPNIAYISVSYMDVAGNHAPCMLYFKFLVQFKWSQIAWHSKVSNDSNGLTGHTRDVDPNERHQHHLNMIHLS